MVSFKCWWLIGPVVINWATGRVELIEIVDTVAVVILVDGIALFTAAVTLLDLDSSSVGSALGNIVIRWIDFPKVLGLAWIPEVPWLGFDLPLGELCCLPLVRIVHAQGLQMEVHWNVSLFLAKIPKTV